MKLFSFIVLLVLFSFPAAVQAQDFSPFLIGRSLVVASSSSGNAYFAGGSVVQAGSIGGDLFSLGGSLLSTAPIAKDALFFGGSIRSQSKIAGDFRAFGGDISSEGEVAGDVIAGGFSVEVSGPVGGDVFIVGADVVFSGGAEGPVNIYGGSVLLAGTFTDDVLIVAASSVTIAEHTRIQGTLSYKAPAEALIPESAEIGNVEYTSAAYLPEAGTSRILAALSMVLFILVRILGALILAGLLAGLFPRFAEVMVSRLYESRPRSALLATLLGFAVLIAAPALILILLLTFVGIGIALLLLILYALVGMLAVLYAGILLGGLLARRFAKRETIRFHDGVLGMLILSGITLIPVGVVAAALFTMFTAGTLLQLFFQFAFPREGGE